MGHLFTRHRHAAQVEKERESISAEATLCKQQLAEAEAALATHKAETKRLGELLHGADQVGCSSCGSARSLAFVGGCGGGNMHKLCSCHPTPGLQVIFTAALTPELGAGQAGPGRQGEA